jgi:hypothetical protein
LNTATEITDTLEKGNNLNYVVTIIITLFSVFYSFLKLSG